MDKRSSSRTWAEPTARSEVGRVARAAPDGYTLSIGQWGTHVLNGAAYTLPYDLLKDFEPISLLTSNPYILVTNKKASPKDLSELIAWIKARDGKATSKSPGWRSA